MMATMSVRVLPPGRVAPILALSISLIAVGAACSGGETADEAVVTTSTLAPTTTSTTASTTASTVPSTSQVTTTTRPRTTTSVPTSTLPTQPTAPIAPPLDAYADEPIIEMGTISIPKIDVAMTMYSGIRMTTLEYGPGHWPGTALPGATGNVVVAGHRTSAHKVFRNIDQLVPGDEIVFDDVNGRHVYEVTRTEIVEPTAVWIVNPTATPTATLFACHPPGSTAQRIVVFADLVTT